MSKVIILFALVATVGTFPIPRLEPEKPQVLSAPKSAFCSELQCRGGSDSPLDLGAARVFPRQPMWWNLPPESAPAPFTTSIGAFYPSVTPAPQTMVPQTMAPQPMAPETMAPPPPSSNDPQLNVAPPLTTPPYTGPGIAVIPHSPFFPEPSATEATTGAVPGDPLDYPTRSGLHHIAVVGVTLVVLALLAICCCLFSNPRIWRSCRHGVPARKQGRLTRVLRVRKESLPPWVQATSRYLFSAKLRPRRMMPMFSQKRKPQGTPSLYGASGYYNTSNSFDSIPSSFSAPDLSGHRSACLTVLDAPPSNNTIGPSDQDSYQGLPYLRPSGTPVRPTPPPVVDSPAGIGSPYYVDVNNRGFYRYPTASVLNNPPMITGIGARPYVLPHGLGPKPVDTDAPRRHTRSQSAPGPDTSSEWTPGYVKSLEMAGSKSGDVPVTHSWKNKSAIHYVQDSKL